MNTLLLIKMKRINNIQYIVYDNTFTKKKYRQLLRHPVIGFASCTDIWIYISRRYVIEIV